MANVCHCCDMFDGLPDDEEDNKNPLKFKEEILAQLQEEVYRMIIEEAEHLPTRKEDKNVRPNSKEREAGF